MLARARRAGGGIRGRRGGGRGAPPLPPAQKLNEYTLKTKSLWVGFRSLILGFSRFGMVALKRARVVRLWVLKFKSRAALRWDEKEVQVAVSVNKLVPLSKLIVEFLTSLPTLCLLSFLCSGMLHRQLSMLPWPPMAARSVSLTKEWRRIDQEELPILRVTARSHESQQSPSLQARPCLRQDFCSDGPETRWQRQFAKLPAPKPSSLSPDEEARTSSSNLWRGARLGNT